MFAFKIKIFILKNLKIIGIFNHTYPKFYKDSIEAYFQYIIIIVCELNITIINCEKSSI